MASSFIEFSSVLLSTLMLCSVIHYMRISCLLQSGGFCLEPDLHGKKATRGIISWVHWIPDLFICDLCTTESDMQKTESTDGRPAFFKHDVLKEKNTHHLSFKKKKSLFPHAFCPLFFRLVFVGLFCFLAIYAASWECVTESVNILEQQ